MKWKYLYLLPPRIAAAAAARLGTRSIKIRIQHSINCSTAFLQIMGLHFTLRQIIHKQLTNVTLTLTYYIFD